MSSLDRDFDEIAIARRYAPRDVTAMEAVDQMVRDINDMPRATETFVEPPPPTPPIERIAELIRTLTYGEMIEFAGELWAKKKGEEITDKDLPAIFHRWSARK